MFMCAHSLISWHVQNTGFYSHTDVLLTSVFEHWARWAGRCLCPSGQSQDQNIPLEWWQWDWWQLHTQVSGPKKSSAHISSIQLPHGNEKGYFILMWLLNELLTPCALMCCSTVPSRDSKMFLSPTNKKNVNLQYFHSVLVNIYAKIDVFSTYFLSWLSPRLWDALSLSWLPHLHCSRWKPEKTIRVLCHMLW